MAFICRCERSSKSQILINDFQTNRSVYWNFVHLVQLTSFVVPIEYGHIVAVLIAHQEQIQRLVQDEIPWYLASRRDLLNHLHLSVVLDLQNGDDIQKSSPEIKETTIGRDVNIGRALLLERGVRNGEVVLQLIQRSIIGHLVDDHVIGQFARHV